MALSSPPLSSILTATRSSSAHVLFYSDSSLTISLSPLKPTNKNTHKLTHTSASEKWRTGVSFFPAFLRKGKDANIIKEELLEAIAPLDRGATATSEDQQTIDQIARKLEVVNPTREPLKSDLLNGKWELIYTTSSSILQTQRPKFLRSRTNYQAINVDTLRAQNMESWPFFNQVLEELLEFLVNKPKFEVQNFCKLIHCFFQPFEVSLLCSQASLHSFHHLFQVTADLKPLNARKVAVKFYFFKILGLVPVKAPERATGELEITYLDEELRVSRGDKGNLFVLKMIDPSYRVPV